jgi:hypothetical protein
MSTILQHEAAEAGADKHDGADGRAEADGLRGQERVATVHHRLGEVDMPTYAPRRRP